MAGKFVSDRNLKFLLYEVLDVESLTRYPAFEDHSRETFDIALETSLRIGRDVLRPYLQEMDKNAPTYDNGVVRVHPMVRSFMDECGKGGWIAAGFPYEFGGQQLPFTVITAVHFIWEAANFSACAFPLLNSGAAHLLVSFGSEDLRRRYLEPMLEGRWQGTMALTEPQAGSSLMDIVTRAEPTDQGYYRISGQKIFISAGDHDAVDNVVHLMLARIQGAPPGAKGISLFVVPKRRAELNGDLVPNDVICAGIFHKLGYRGAPITHLIAGENGDCRGWLVGEPHRGLSYMFQMMNEARIEVGLAAAGIASAAYYASLEYCLQRPQGRRLGEKNASLPPVLIVEHPDVKRMLLFQRAIVEGSLSLILQCSRYSDLARATEGEERQRYELLLDLLTPVAKTYPSEMGLISVSQGLQCLGGYGYCDEFPLEQHYRDVRIHPIHEGTTGIQGLDLLGRKVVMRDGAAVFHFLDELASVTRRAREDSTLAVYAERLDAAVEQLKSVTGHLVGFGMRGDLERFLGDASLYLEFFGIISVAWQWLLQGISASKGLSGACSDADSHFYTGKLHTMRYFFHYELPKIDGLSRRLMEADSLAAETRPEWFRD